MNILATVTEELVIATARTASVMGTVSADPIAHVKKAATVVAPATAVENALVIRITPLPRATNTHVPVEAIADAVSHQRQMKTKTPNVAVAMMLVTENATPKKTTRNAAVVTTHATALAT